MAQPTFDEDKGQWAKQPAIVVLTDTTGGAVTDAVDDATASVKDDIASLAAKINELRTALINAGILATD